MRKKYLLTMIFGIILMNCSSNDDEPNPETAEPFSRANQLQFYFSNPTNADLLDLNNNIVLPIAYEEIYTPTTLPPKNDNDPKKYFYNGGSIEYDSALQKYYWNTVITGKKGIKQNKIFVRISETDTDTLDVKFKFTKDAIGTSDGFYAYMEKLYYNGTLIHEENSNKKSLIDSVKRVFIQKNGKKTVISFMN